MVYSEKTQMLMVSAISMIMNRGNIGNLSPAEWAKLYDAYDAAHTENRKHNLVKESRQ